MCANFTLQLLGTVKAAEQELLTAEKNHIKERVCEERGGETYLHLCEELLGAQGVRGGELGADAGTQEECMLQCGLYHSPVWDAGLQECHVFGAMV